MGGWGRYRPEIFYILCPPTMTSHGRLMLAVLGRLAEFERDLIRVRTGAGRGVRIPVSRREG